MCYSPIFPNAEIDVRALRNELGLTQEQFALRYGFDVDAVRNWEQQRRKPEAATASYLRVIAKMPKEASEALEEPLDELLADALALDMPGRVQIGITALP